MNPVVGGEADDRMLRMSQVDLCGLGKCGCQLRPPGFVKGAHLRDLLGVIAGHVARLPAVLA